MKKQIYSILVAILLIIFGVYTKTHEVPSPKEQVTGAVTIQYDKSIKTEIGKPIKVARVIDGDTIELINGEHLRYIGIDTPEEFDARKPVQCFAVEAAARNKALVEGQTITFQKDVSTYDKYGRWLGYVYLPDGTMVNEQLVKEGMAFSYPYKPDISKQDMLNVDQNTAKQNKLGLWGNCTVTALSTGRLQTNPVQ
jgi:micrococcal nuclease